MPITEEINRPISRPYRRAYIKRRQSSNGLFEPNWTEITEYVKNWGTLESSIDNIRFSKFRQSGVTLKVRNDTGKFNHHTNADSLWASSYLTRHWTLLRVNAGYFDDSDTTLPPTDTVGIFLLDNEVVIDSENNEAVLQFSSLRNVFDKVHAQDIAGLGTTMSSSTIVTTIRDYTDGAAAFVFREFITSTAWNFTTGTASLWFNLATTTTLQGKSAWDVLEGVAEADNYVTYIDREGNLVYKTRDANTTTTQFSLYGQGFTPQNVIRLNQYKEALNTFYNFYRLHWGQTTTVGEGYVTAGTTTVLNPSNTAWISGNRIYNYDNFFFSSAALAQTSVNQLFNNSALQNEVNLTCKFIPHLNLLDRVDLNFRSYDIVGRTLYDVDEYFNTTSTYYPPTVGAPRLPVYDNESGINFNFNATAFRIISIKHDLDNLTTTFVMRQI